MAKHPLHEMDEDALPLPLVQRQNMSAWCIKFVSGDLRSLPALDSLPRTVWSYCQV